MTHRPGPLGLGAVAAPSLISMLVAFPQDGRIECVPQMRTEPLGAFTEMLA